MCLVFFFLAVSWVVVVSIPIFASVTMICVIKNAFNHKKVKGLYFYFELAFEVFVFLVMIPISFVISFFVYLVLLHS